MTVSLLCDGDNKGWLPNMIDCFGFILCIKTKKSLVSSYTLSGWGRMSTNLGSLGQESELYVDIS